MSDRPRKRSPHAHGPSEVWQRGAVVRAIAAAQRDIGQRLRALREERKLSQEAAAERISLHAKHLQRVERATANPTIGTLVAIAVGYGISLRDLLSGAEPAADTPFHVIADAEARPFKNCVPLYPLDAAAGAFGSARPPSGPAAPAAWVVPHAARRIGPGMFVARVVGESMNRRIPSGAYCLFRAPADPARQGRVFLVQLRDRHDPESGGEHTVKLWRTRRVGAASQAELAPDSTVPSYAPMVMPAEGEGAVEPIAELLEVLPGTAAAP